MKKMKRKSRLLEVWRQLKKSKLAVVSLFVLILLVLVGIFAPLIAPYGYADQDASLSFAKPSAISCTS